MKKRVLLSFFAFQQNLIKCEVKIYLEFILVTKDIHEVSTFVSKKYPFSYPHIKTRKWVFFLTKTPKWVLCKNRKC